MSSTTTLWQVEGLIQVPPAQLRTLVPPHPKNDRRSYRAFAQELSGGPERLFKLSGYLPLRVSPHAAQFDIYICTAFMERTFRCIFVALRRKLASFFHVISMSTWIVNDHTRGIHPTTASVDEMKSIRMQMQKARWLIAVAMFRSLSRDARCRRCVSSHSAECNAGYPKRAFTNGGGHGTHVRDVSFITSGLNPS